MPTLAQIAGAFPDTRVQGNSEVMVTGATHDSRQVRPGFLFAAMAGDLTDGRRFIDDAITRGAVALLVGAQVPLDLPQIVTADPRVALGPISSACYSYPTRELALIGITGTNGKTTITYMVEAMLDSVGHHPGVMGTVAHRFKERTWNDEHTTPEAPVIQSVVRAMVDDGASHMLMEVSSHGLALHRLKGCAFDVVAFTNLTQDHLDFHGDMEEYAAAKMLLFTDVIEGISDARAVINIDDPFSGVILERLKKPAVTVSCDPSSVADIRPVNKPGYDIEGINARIHTPSGVFDLSSPLLGPHNMNNILVSMGICIQLRVDIAKAIDGLERFEAVPGRLQRVPCKRGFTVLVDYAHTPDALVSVLKALKPITEGRLICVFGCGGDRDHSKRPLMGDAVARGADVAIVTSDNPRTEDPKKIVEMILPGVDGGGLSMIAQSELGQASSGYAVEVDRGRAISMSLRCATAGDTVLIAGKGHEDYQILGKNKIHFDDAEHAAAAIASLGKEGADA